MIHGAFGREGGERWVPGVPTGGIGGNTGVTGLCNIIRSTERESKHRAEYANNDTLVLGDGVDTGRVTVGIL